MLTRLKQTGPLPVGLGLYAAQVAQVRLVAVIVVLVVVMCCLSWRS